MERAREAEPVKLRQARDRLGDGIKKVSLYGLLVVGAFFMIVPFYWMFVLSTQATRTIRSFPPPLWFGGHLVENYYSLLEAIPFLRNFMNSVLVSTSHTLLVLLFCSMAGYAFAMYRFPGRRILFAICLGTLMVPWMAGIVPWFILMTWFGWVDSLLALIIPGSANAFGIFWMRQYIAGSIDPELLQAARIDGCPEWQIFFRVVLPILRPALSALAILTFVTSWNNFLVPLIILRSDPQLTLPVALNALFGDPTRGFDLGAMMMGTSLAVLPLLIVFLFAAKQFMKGMTAGALKG